MIYKGGDMFLLKLTTGQRAMIVTFKNGAIEEYTTETLNKTYDSLIKVSDEEFDRHLSIVKAVD